MRYVWLLLALVLTSTSAWAQAPPGLLQKIQAIRAAHAGRMQIGVSVVQVESGRRVDVSADPPYPLASVFKLPVMLEMARQLQHHENNLSLETRLTVTEATKCIGSGTLKNAPDGTRLTLARAVELMETISDNTAADLVFNAIGTGSVDRFLHGLGLNGCHIFLTNRAAWLISLAHGSEFRGMGPAQIVSRWAALTHAQKEDAARRILAENEGLTVPQFQAIEDASESRPYAQDMLVAEATDNVAPPAELATLLVRFVKGELLDAHWTQYCLDVLSRQQFNSRIPRLLPAGTPVYHKTGTLEGIVNDAGVIEISNDNHVVVVVLCKRVARGASSEAGTAIAHIARAAYDAFR